MYRGYKLVFHASSMLEEGVAAWCDIRALEYAVETRPQDPEHGRFSVFPDQTLPPDEVRQELREFLSGWMAAAGLAQPLPEIRVRAVRQDWERAWKRFFKGKPVGERFFIAPPWEGAAPGDRMLLTIDPGPCFGTGHHPTTMLCIRYLEAHPPRGFAVLDAGSGSGVLAFAALLLGAETACGFDIDPEAMTVARANAACNGLEAEFRSGGPETFAGCRFDVILANMLPRNFLPMVPALLALSRPGAGILFSGIGPEQRDEVREKLADFPLDMEEEVSLGEWFAWRTRVQ